MKKLLRVLVCCALFTQAEAQTTPARDLVKEGVQLYDAGQYDQAVAKYQQALAAEPDLATAQAELALTYNALGRNEEAKAVCEKLLRQKPDVGASVYVTYGNSLDALHQFKDAERAYRRGMKQYPNAYSLYYNLGVAQAGQQQYTEAVASLREAVVRNPGHASSHLTMGLVQSAQHANVPAVLELARFLALEQQTERAKRRLPLLLQLLNNGVTKQDSAHTTIAVSSQLLDKANSKRTTPDDFSSVEFMLTMTAATQKGRTEVERFASQFEGLCQLLAETAPKHKEPGFTWTYYVPYFVEMQRKGFVPAFAYLAYAGQPASATQAQQWLAAHATEVQVYQEWAKRYEWPKPKP